MVEKLHQHGFTLQLSDVFSPAPACIAYLRENKLRPFLLVHSSALPDYSGIDCSNPNCIVLGDACEVFNYENMNKAFRILINTEQPALISLGQGYDVYVAREYTMLPAQNLYSTNAIWCRYLTRQDQKLLNVLTIILWTLCVRKLCAENWLSFIKQIFKYFIWYSLINIDSISNLKVFY